MTEIRALEPQADAAVGDALLEHDLQQISRGDRAAFERLYRRTSVKLLAVCRRVLPEVHDAEEALQAAYLTIWRRAETYNRSRGRPMTWLITLAHRSAIDTFRQRRRSSQTLSPLVADPPAGFAAEASDASMLELCLQSLEEFDRRLLHTAFFEGATYGELAQRSEAPLGTIKSRIRRALHKLAECLR